ncbi:TatD family hydrolase [Blastopirellula marina]|uniref:Hydrolase TatD n=1 Tax=Blastopirellula marina TaxID=124 RepID=A0A2S8FT99_9BACT|nr:TatD family hydrolase [Blastopirellula marina]PQO35403.1 hydrolase TatD [Blastopirellula marina]PTL44043.1 TatD family deoxyribonuclease [Blastopirellula marina]
MILFDTHAHLFDETLISQIDDVVARAKEAGVGQMMVVGTTAEDSVRAIEIAERFPEVYATVGIQPNNCAEAKPGDWDKIVELLEHPKVVALGETGLDRYWDFTPFELQQDYFDRHLRLSQERDFPFIVHMRDCGDDIVVMLKEAAERGPLRGVMHSFTGDPALMQQCLDLDMYISFAGMVTFKKSGDLRDVAALVPKDRILIETDAPYLSPEPVRGKRPNEPAYVAHTAACVAAARGESLEEFAELTTANARRLFRRVQGA